MHTIDTSRFVNNTLSVRALVPLEEDTITGWNVLVWMMRSATERWPDRQSFSEALGRAYAMHVRAGLTGYGSRAGVEVVFEWIRPALIEEPDYPGQVLEIMEQVLFHPDLSPQRFEEACWMIRSRLLRQEEDPDTAAVLAALAAAGADTPLAVSISGTLEGLDRVTLEEVRDLWQTWRSMPKGIYAVGQLSPAVLDFVRDLPQAELTGFSHQPLAAAAKPYRVVSARDIMQTSLVQGYTTGITLADPESAALLVLSSILGSGQKSLLFEEVRERHSWCYAISCSLIRFDGLLLITAGTRRRHLEELQAAIAAQIRRIREDDYPQSLFDAAILDLTDGICARQDFPSSQIETAFQQDLLSMHRTQQEQLQRLQAVTREQVRAVADRLTLAVTSIVQEESEHEED
ncbi:pitrilysin family protein [uncultured Faecalibaculum sp.]|uniref:M16 family metallopeptidase n=2 Tax=uncultured Faecalibaculum sp. TaxID=1729681 RepID=UPI002604A2A9|nr:insulinase family protein [uncultured Faecalibaculum sp.]